MPAEITAAPQRGSSKSFLSFIDLRVLCCLLMFMCAVAVPASSNAATTDFDATTATVIQIARDLRIQDDALPSEQGLARFYRQRSFEPAWLSAKRLAEVTQLSDLARLHGLNAADYGFTDLHAVVRDARKNNNDTTLAQIELELATQIARLAYHLRYGKVDQVGRYPELRGAKKIDPHHVTELLTGAAQSETLFAYLHNLAPSSLLYRQMLSSLQAHRRLLDTGAEWPMIPNGRTLEPGMRDTRIKVLRARLAQPADSDDHAELYDPQLATSVAEFQAAHALEPDGLLGAQTLAALNVSIATRIDQLRVNLDAQRWADMREHAEYLLVNVAQYQLHHVVDGNRVASMRTQVGRRVRPTPAFKSALTSIVANPTWTVPPTIFAEDVLPLVQADAAYLQRNNMYMVDRRGQRVSTEGVDWHQVVAGEFPYRLRSGPYDGNALGRLKFQMPNPYLIYLHDTPSKHLFGADQRATSSGCIRLEKPEELARLVLSRQKKLNADKLDGLLASERTRYMELDQSFPIVVMYGSIDINAEGQLIFGRDVYRHDRLALTALNNVDESRETSPPSRFALANLTASTEQQ